MKNVKNENLQHIEKIARDLNSLVNGELFKCPVCGEIFEAPPFEACPDCDEDLEPISILDYFSDCLDIEYRVNGKNADEINSVKIMIAYGGPTIFVDTGDRKIKLYWWTEYEEVSIFLEVAEAITEAFNELWIY